jgi:hypothetical protein
VLGDSIFQRVQSFAELATALHAFSSTRAFSALPAAVREPRLSPALTGFFRTARADDEMRQFLIGAIEYLGSFAEGNIEVPVSIIRYERCRAHYKSKKAFCPRPARCDRCCLLQIARQAKTADLQPAQQFRLLCLNSSEMTPRPQLVELSIIVSTAGG